METSEFEDIERRKSLQASLDAYWEEQAATRQREGFNRLAPEERYRRDATFKQLVDILCLYIHKAQLTPTEVGEAAVLAAIKYETQYSYSNPYWRVNRPSASAEVIDPHKT